jgi:choline kinase
MDAIVLAAGEGLRFFGKKFEQRPLPPGWEYPIPKALFPVAVPQARAAPRPILGHLVNALQDGGAETIWIATGHLGEKIDAFVEAAFAGSNVVVIPPHASIDYRKGPLYTLAGALDYLNENGVLARQGFDKMVMLSPADLIIDRKAVWYIAGIPARGMMSSRSRVHVIIENRPGAGKTSEHTRLKDLLPSRFQHLFDAVFLACPVVPLMAVHLEVLKAWLEANIRDDHAFRSEVNIIQSVYLGEKFYWYDLDTFDAVWAMEQKELST